MSQRLPAKTKSPQKAEIAQPISITSPIGGLNSRDPISSMGAVYATSMVNFWPEARAVTLRKGATDWSTGYAKETKTIMPYRPAGAAAKLLVATDDGVFDGTAQAAVGAVMTPLTSGWCRYANINTPGGAFLFVVNGVDQARYYNGAAWTLTATYTIGAGPSTLPTIDIVNVNLFKNRLYFIRKDSLHFYYFDINSIAGTVSDFDLGAIFLKGGKLLAMGTWTVDAGEGQDDYAVFITDQGQCAVYKGADPSAADDWSLVGVYDVGNPIGYRCLTKLGGDLLLMTYGGVISLAKALQSTKIAITSVVTDLIQPTFQEQARLYSDNTGWQFQVNEAIAMLVVNVPLVTTGIPGLVGQSTQYAMNLTTGAWTQFTGWDAAAWEVLGKDSYFAVGNKIAKAWTLTPDFGQNFQATVRQAWTYLPQRARQKQIRLMRPVAKVGGSLSVAAAVDTDFNDSDNTNYGPVIFSSFTNSRWNSAIWNSATWGRLPTMLLNWLTVANTSAYCTAVRLRVIGGDSTFEWSATDYAYETGSIQG